MTSIIINSEIRELSCLQFTLKRCALLFSDFLCVSYCHLLSFLCNPFFVLLLRKNKCSSFLVFVKI